MTPDQLRAKQECEAYQRRKIAQRKRQKRDRTIALLIVLGIILAIFGGGVAFGWHLGTAHTVANTVEAAAPQTSTPDVKSPTAPTVHTFEISSPPAATEKVLILSNDIISDGNLLSFELQETMQLLCEEYGVPYALALAVADHESRFLTDAVSKTNDYGLMQINKVNFEWLKEKGIDPLTARGNIEAGVLMLSQRLKRYGEAELALMAYNCGDAGAKRLWEAGTYSTGYSRKVMERYEKWLAVLEAA